MAGPDDFDLEEETSAELKTLFIELRRISHELKINLEQLHNDMMWVRKHLSSLRSHLMRLGVIHELPTEEE